MSNGCSNRLASSWAIGQAVRTRAPIGFLIAARGSSDNAAVYAKYLLQQRNRIPVALAAPSLFTHYRTPPGIDRFCVLGISQSGKSPDVAAVLHEGRRQGAITIAIARGVDPDRPRALKKVTRT